MPEYQPCTPHHKLTPFETTLRRAIGALDVEVAESKLVIMVEVDTPAVNDTRAATFAANTFKLDPGVEA